MTDDITARLFVRADWQKQAACRGMGPDAFYPPRGDAWQKAAAICNTCPVQQPCADAGSDEQYGIWGGRSVAVIRRKTTAAPAVNKPGGQFKPIAHGTGAGYQQERHRGLTPCHDCRDAYTADRRARRARKAAA